MAKRKTRNFGDVIRAELASDQNLAEMVEEETINADIAQQVYELRAEAGLTQKQLADLVHTQQSVISRIEDADYDGHSLKMLQRIARALNRKLKIDFCARRLQPAGKVREFTMDWEQPFLSWQTAMHASVTSNVPCEVDSFAILKQFLGESTAPISGQISFRSGQMY